MEIFIQAQGQPDLLPLSVELATTIVTVRQTLAEMMRVSPEAIQLAFAGAMLEDDATLESVKVGDGGTLQLGIDRRATGGFLLVAPKSKFPGLCYDASCCRSPGWVRTLAR